MKKFNNRLFGYSKAEVNSFVNEVTKNYEDMLNSLKESNQKNAELNESLVIYKNMENSLNKALLVAESASVQIKRLAREEANNMLLEAKKDASRIVNNALLKAERTESDADNLRLKINVYRKRLRAVLEEQINMIDNFNEDI